MVNHLSEEHPEKPVPSSGKRAVITLTTDFGTADEYVAAMKGVLLSLLDPIGNVQLVDICHEIPAQDINSAAFIFSRAYRYFPAGTVHIVVVDPGVGSGRRIIAIESEHQVFIGPDNGVFTEVLRKAASNVAFSRAYEVTNSELFLPQVSSTFHGRDIMAPVAAALATGTSIAVVGKEINASDCVNLPIAQKELGRDFAKGQIIHIDRFGNLSTNLTAADLQPLLKRGPVRISVGSTTIDGLSTSYSTAPKSCLLAHFDSHFHLEIAVRDGSAAALLKARTGTAVRIQSTAT